MIVIVVYWVKQIEDYVIIHVSSASVVHHSLFFSFDQVSQARLRYKQAGKVKVRRLEFPMCTPQTSRKDPT